MSLSASPQLFRRALAHFHQGQWQQAAECCARALDADARHFDALHLLGLIALQRGEPLRALELLRRSLAINAQQPVVHLNASHAQLRLQNPQAALASADAALALRPGYAEALVNRAGALLALGRPHEALVDYERTAESRPSLPESLRGRAEVLLMLQRFDEALPAARAFLERRPDDAVALDLHARALLALRRPQDALSDLDRALALQPEAAGMLLSRGNARFQLEDIEGALADYTRAATLQPDNADLAFNRGNALLRLRRFAEAMACYDTAIRLHPQMAKAHYYRGNALRSLDRPEESLADYERALAIEPRYVDAVNGIGNALRDLRHYAQALEQYEAALRIDPASVEALRNCGRVLLALNRPEEAGRCLDELFRVAPEAAPDCDDALGMRLHARLLCCEWHDYDSLRSALLAAVLSGKRASTPWLMIANSDSCAAQLRCAQRFFADHWAGIRPLGPHGVRMNTSRIRLAYVSADFGEHPVAMLMAGIFESHDRKRFELIAIALRPAEDSSLGRRVQRAFDRFIDVSGQSDREVALLLRDLEIDIAIDLNGYTHGARPGIFAHRGARIQVNFLGYSGTLGAPCMDYLIADRIVIREAERAWYAESVVYLPDCFLPAESSRSFMTHAPSRVELGLPEAGFVFCCFNGSYKIVPAVFDIWMRLVGEFEGSVLWLAAKNEIVTRNLRSEAERRGIDPSRLLFAPRLADSAAHLLRYRAADIFLDTVPCNAHSTASDALSVGLPVLTCRGATFSGRIAASLLEAEGLGELVAENLSEYESLARHLAATPAQLSALRERLEHRGPRSAFNRDRQRKHLEAAYEEMIARRGRREAALSFAVGYDPTS